MMRIRHIFEALGLLVGLAVLRLLTPEAASNLGGFVCRKLGPRVGFSDRARRNLRLAMPELSAERIEEIVTGMWDNLGRTFAEYPHLGVIADPKSGRVIFEGESGSPGDTDTRDDAHGWCFFLLR